MKKNLKISLIIVISIIGVIIIDSLQALVFNNNPIIGINTKCSKKVGLLVNTYNCGNERKITKFKLFNSSCDSDIVCENDNSNELEEIIKNNFKKIIEVNNAISSNPYDYINNEYYQNIINLGSKAVPILIKMFRNENGLEAYISAIMIQEITNCNIKDKYHLSWETGKEFYQLWDNYNCGYNSNSKDYIIVDKSKEIDGFVCASALEPFYEDDKYIYSFSCIMSDYIVVRYHDGKEEKIKDALKKNLITIEDLDNFNIKYYKDAK